MGVDDAERRLLVLQIGEHAHQHDVLDDVGKAAGMKGVTVVHVMIVLRSQRVAHVVLVMPGLVPAFAKASAGLTSELGEGLA
ncbi:hypothetical protein QIH80_36260 [Bradyrhizobium elkanii]|nr:hypothetical protein QIH80_36260 [Bradyrhizobium elkanii]